MAAAVAGFAEGINAATPLGTDNTAGDKELAKPWLCRVMPETMLSVFGCVTPPNFDA